MIGILFNYLFDAVFFNGTKIVYNLEPPQFRSKIEMAKEHIDKFPKIH